MKPVTLLICLFMLATVLSGQDKAKEGSSGKPYEPVGLLAGKTYGTISRESAMAAPILEATLMRFDVEIQYKVVSFKLLISKGGSDVELSARSNQITSQMRSGIAGMSKGQTMVFKDIKAVDPDGKTVNVKPLTLTIE